MPSTTSPSPAPRLTVADPTDRALARRTAAGDEHAFDLLVLRHRERLVRLAERIAVDGRAEDAVQVAFLRAYASLRDGVIPDEPQAWLSVVTRHAAIDQVRSVARTEPHAVVDPGSAASAEDVAASREDLRRRLGTLAALPGQEREALLMRSVDGAGHLEIGAALQVSPGQARQLIHRARRRLRDVAAILLPAWFALKVQSARAAAWVAEFVVPGATPSPGRALGAVAALSAVGATAGPPALRAVDGAAGHRSATEHAPAHGAAGAAAAPAAPTAARSATITASGGAAVGGTGTTRVRPGAPASGTGRHRSSRPEPGPGAGSDPGRGASTTTASAPAAPLTAPDASGGSKGSGSDPSPSPSTRHSGSEHPESASSSRGSGSDDARKRSSGGDDHASSPSDSGSGASGSGSGSGSSESSSSGSGSGSSGSSGSGSGSSGSSGSGSGGAGSGRSSDDTTADATPETDDATTAAPSAAAAAPADAPAPGGNRRSGRGGDDAAGADERD